MADVLGSIGSGLGTVASDVGQGIGQIGGDLMSGAKDLFSGLGGLFGLSGGGGPLSPGTIANTASSPLAGAGSAASAAPAAASSAAAFGMPPGLGDAISAGLPNVAGINTSDIANIGAGVAADPALAAGGGGMTSFLQQLLQPKTAIPLGALGLDLMHGLSTPPEVKQLKHLEAEQAGLANRQNALGEAAQEGILPAGAQHLVEGTLRANEAAIRTKYAQMGMSGSSAEAQDLQAARDQALQEQFTIGQGIATQGLATAQAATGQESSLLSAILAQEMAQGSDFAQALADFAGAAAK